MRNRGLQKMQAEMLASEPQVDGKYFVAGMVEHPGSYSFHVPTTVLGALSLAGRFKDDVSQEKIVLMRGDRKLDFRYSALIKGEVPERDVLLETGDVLFVPAGNQAAFGLTVSAYL